jgi:hypothetical protein
VAWPTWKYLLLIDDSLASVRYKGWWGANIKVFNAYAGRAAGLPTMKNGPSGPAYKTAWFKGTQHVSPPFVPPAGGPNTKDVLSLTPESLDFGITHGARTQLDLVLENKLSEPMTVRLQVVSAIAADWDSRKVGEPLYPAILSIGPIARSGLKLEPNERTIVPVIAQIQIPSSKIGSKLSIYSPSRFKGYVAASAMGKDGWIVVPVTGGINGGALKRGGPSGFISDVKIKEGDIPPLDLSDQAIG